MSDKKDVPGSLDQPGLELASQYQPPEVAHGQAPEAYTPADDRWRSEKYVIPNTPNQDSHYDQTPRNDEQPGGRTEKRTCGIQRKKFLWIMLGAVVLVIVVLAAVLGGVLGSRKGSSYALFFKIRSFVNQADTHPDKSPTKQPQAQPTQRNLALSI